MALVRCSCITQLGDGRGRSQLTVLVADPDCRYVVHRVAGPSTLAEGLDAPT